MDTTQLKWFQTIARCEHLTKAAEALNISQPALSVNLKRLEQELGLPLFDRSGRGIRLNEGGEIFLKYADRILQEVANAQTALTDYAERESSRLTLFITSKSSELPILEFKMANPQIFVRKQDIIYNEIPQILAGGGFDFIVTSCLNPEDFGGRYQVFGESSVMAAIPRSNPLSQLESVSLSQLRNEDFIVLPYGSALREITEKLCADAGFVPKVAAESYYCQLDAYLNHGFGVALIADKGFGSCAHLSDNPAYVKLPLEGVPELREVLLWNRGQKLSKTARLFLKTIVDLYSGDGQPQAEPLSHSL